MAGRQAWEGSSEAGSWSSFLENRPPVLFENRIAVETANPRGPLQPKKLSVWRVSFIYFFFLYDHNTNYTLKPIWVISPRKKADPIPPSTISAKSVTMHLECFLKSSRSFDHFHCCVSASASIQGLAAVGGSDSSWEAAPTESVAGGGGGGDNDHSETTYLSNCLLYNKNYSVALSLNSQREGAAGGSWRLLF